ncbi:MAG: ABC transporter permease [Thermoanaerobaculia bacterium]
MAGGKRALAAGATLVGLFFALGALAPWLAPHPPNEQHDPLAAGDRPPATRMTCLELADGRRLCGDRCEPLALGGFRLERQGEWREVAADDLAAGPSGQPHRLRFPLGTDRYARDLYSRLLYGARVSMTLSLVSVLLALSLGVGVGSIAGTARPWLDHALMRLVDALLAVPSLVLILALSALFRPGNGLLVLVLGGTGWMEVSRLVRAEIKDVAARDFILAAEAAGLPSWRIVVGHLLPNSLAPVLAMGPILVGNIILAESALSFLGMGIQPPQASWGTIINDGRDSLPQAWWVSLLPGVAIALAVIGWNLLGEGLKQRLDPRQRSQSSE